MEKKALGIGIVGAGRTGIKSVIQHTIEEDKGDLVWTAAVMDNVPGKAKFVAEEYGIPAYYEDLDEMLKDPNVDIITIASPIGLHFEQGMKAIRAGKHVHFNKTMTISTEEATTLIEEAKKYGVKIVSSPGQMVSPVLRKVRKAILTGEMGMPTWTIGGIEGVMKYHTEEANRTMGGGFNHDPSWYFKAPAGGPVWDCAVYALHAMTGIHGPVKRVSCMSGLRHHDYQFLGKPIQSEMDDNVYMLLDFGDAFFGVIYASMKNDFGPHNGYNSMTFATEGKFLNGILETKNGSEVLLDPSRRNDPEYNRATRGMPHLTDHQMTLPEPHIYEDINQLADWVLNGVKPYCSVEHARHVIEIIEAAYKSVETGKVVELTTTFEPIPLEELGV